MQFSEYLSGGRYIAKKQRKEYRKQPEEYKRQHTVATDKENADLP